jgi:hypothetical protein
MSELFHITNNAQRSSLELHVFTEGFFLRTPQRDRQVSDGTRIRDPLRDRQTFYIVLVSLCQNCARIQRFQIGWIAEESPVSATCGTFDFS